MKQQSHPADYLIRLSQDLDAKKRNQNSIAEYTLLMRDEETLFVPLHAIHGSTIFRGQNKRYSPCVPSIWRGTQFTHLMNELSIKEQANAVFLHAKSLWFNRDIELHPAIKWARNNKFYVDKLSLAQHYELPTDYIDFSHNFSVAAFFATNRKNGDSWEPMEQGKGVLYILNFKALPKWMLMDTVKPISLQPLPRPEEQSGWVVAVPLGHDLESHPGVYYAEFEHSEEVSRYFHEMFDGGKKLFPKDSLADISDSIQHWEQPIDESIVDRIIKHWGNAEWGIKRPDEVKKHISETIGFSDVPNYVAIENFDARIESLLESKFKSQWLEVYVVDENGNIERLRVDH